MPQLVFLHGPGAGGCAAAWTHQLAHFPGSLAPTLPGNLEGKHCATVAAYTEWLRGWLWVQGKARDLVLMGYTLGSAIALQYALDYPEEVKGLILTSIEARPRPDQSAFRKRTSGAVSFPRMRDMSADRFAAADFGAVGIVARKALPPSRVEHSRRPPTPRHPC